MISNVGWVSPPVCAGSKWFGFSRLSFLRMSCLHAFAVPDVAFPKAALCQSWGVTLSYMPPEPQPSMRFTLTLPTSSAWRFPVDNLGLNDLSS